MTVFRVTTVGYDLADAMVDSFDYEDAAADACEMLDSGGSFAGGPIPDELLFDVTDVITGETRRVVVTHDYSTNWYAQEREP